MPRNVLIATPHADIANSLRLGLEVSDRYQPHIAQSGSEAVARLKADEIDLVILDGDMTEELLTAAWNHLFPENSGPRLVVVGRGGRKTPDVLENLHPACFFHYPVYLPEFLDYLDDLLIMKPTSPQFSTESNQPLPGASLPWLGNYEAASSHLQQQFFATSADAALIYLSGIICALAGSLEKSAALQVAKILLAHWDETNPSDLARYITIGEDRQEYFLYATLLSGSSVLCCLFAPDLSLSQCRAHTHQLRRGLLETSPALPEEPPAEAAQPSGIESLPDSEFLAFAPEEHADSLQSPAPLEQDDLFRMEEESGPLTLSELFQSTPLQETAEAAPDNGMEIDLKSLLEEMPSPDPDQPLEAVPDTWEEIGLVFPWETETKTEPPSMQESAPGEAPSVEPPAVESEISEEDSVFAQLLAQAEVNITGDDEWVPPLEDELDEPSLESVPTLDGTVEPAVEAENGFWQQDTQPVRVSPPPSQEDLPASESDHPAAPEVSPLQRLRRVVADEDGLEDTRPVRVRPAEEQPTAETTLRFPWEAEPPSAAAPLQAPFLQQDEQSTPAFDLNSFREENDDLILYEDDDGLFTIVLAPQNERHTLTGQLAEKMHEWFEEVCDAHQWELRSISVQPSYVLMTILAQPTMTSAFVINTLRTHTTRRLFNNHPNVKKELRSDDFWAPSHLVYNGEHPIEFVELMEFVDKAQHDQNNWFDSSI
ncbi:hypothetical protein ADN00_04910 [Ornatilinea apprima]|uniref:Response regulatory domain-containing protein n=1 Tax=Ornatilinea apprima TaxID=1134406 RepID=A0A0P6Y2N8_9CHLR|nr:IS200/IS605 family transposase [Ornatilinea apprima]KPL79188.1 hypothetical protein ADN00_04910 [Ornatilinea apprima]